MLARSALVRTYCRTAERLQMNIAINPVSASLRCVKLLASYDSANYNFTLLLSTNIVVNWLHGSLCNVLLR